MSIVILFVDTFGGWMIRKSAMVVCWCWCEWWQLVSLCVDCVHCTVHALHLSNHQYPNKCGTHTFWLTCLNVTSTVNNMNERMTQTVQIDCLLFCVIYAWCATLIFLFGWIVCSSFSVHAHEASTAQTLTLTQKIKRQRKATKRAKRKNNNNNNKELI